MKRTQKDSETGQEHALCQQEQGTIRFKHEPVDTNHSITDRTLSLRETGLVLVTRRYKEQTITREDGRPLKRRTV